VEPTGRELEALKVLWERGRATVREVYEALRPGDGELAYTTVLSLMQTMERKGLVAHEAAGKAYVYRAVAREDGVFRSLARGFLDRVFDGALDQYVARAIESRPPSAAELDELERLVAEARRKAGGGRKGRGGGR
jgi:predicted transcriptional regulator